jgi:Fe-S-cluster-containing hydrogenase component 2
MPEKELDRKYTRRHFLNNVGLGAGGLMILGSYGFSFSRNQTTGMISAILVDFGKCAGCRTCESVCSEFNHKISIEDKMVNGTANPYLSNIRVYHYNPDIDIPSTCALCDDSPCVEACPVEPHSETGRKALYRDEQLLTINNDPERCIGCQSCAIECSQKRAGVIRSDPETGGPTRICTLCNGDPQCARHCPYDALKYAEMASDRKLDNLSPDRLAEIMIKKMYNIDVKLVEA